MDFFNKTQKQKVIDRINEVGYVDNFWAIKNYILRLGAIIHDLKENNGYTFTGRWGTGSEKKNYHYYSMAHVEADLFGYHKK